MESEVVFQMAVDPHDVRHAGGQRHARRDRAASCDPAISAHAPGRNDVVAAAAIGEHAQLVVQIRRTVHADGHADVVVREKLDDGGREQRRVGRQAEIDGPALFRRAFVA